MALSKNDSRLVAQGAPIQVSIRRKATRRRRRQAERRGVILLVIIGLLTLFTLIGLTFVLATSQASLGAKAASRANRTGTPPPKLHRRALLQIVRGHENPPTNTAYPQWLGSVIGPHSLLEDFYGDDWLIAPITANGFATAPTAGAAAFCMGQGSMMYIEVSLYGADGQPGFDTIDDDGNGTVDDQTELGYGDDFQPTAGYYNGRVITMVDGAARGKSSRITGYEIINLTSTPPLGRLRLLPFEGMTAQLAGGVYSWQSPGAPQPADRFLINGRAFNGTGFGFNPATTPTTGLLDLSDSSAPSALLALLPNPTSPAYRFAMSGPDGIVGSADDLFSNADEDYDAPDFQNMLVAGQFWDAFATPPRWEVRVPSLHRPALINYWAMQVGGGTWNGVPLDVKRKISLRPLPEDHFKDLNNSGTWDAANEPAFTGGNPSYDPINGPWDVDNDGDGLPDSIWVDLGFPVQTAPDGRKYKPLFAILCLDLDGRLNLNVHSKPGDYRMISPAPGGPPDEEYLTTITNLFPGPYAGAYTDTNGNGRYDAGEPLTAVRLPIGAGFGVADVNLAVVLPNPVADSTTATGTRNELRQLIEGRVPGGLFSFAIPGRNGDPHLLYAASGVPRPGATSTGVLVHGGMFPSAFDDYFNGDDNRPLGVMSMVGGNTQAEYYGNLYQDGYFPGIALGVNGSPPGLAGNGSVALDWRGQPFWWNSGYAGTPNAPATGALQESIDDPYELDVTLGHRGAGDPATAGNALSLDSPYSAAEMEYFLRIHDADALALPGRLGVLAPSLANPSNAYSRLVTTESRDPASPNVIPTYDMIVGEDETPGGPDSFAVRMAPTQQARVHITDLLRYRLAQWGVTSANMDTEIAKLLSPDLMAGLRMDINRPFGDGLDNNGNGVVDEVLEALAGISGSAGADRLWRDPGADTVFGTMDDGTGVPFDANADGTIDFNDSLARHELAKHFYVLLMLFKDYNYSHPTPGEPGIPPADQAELTSRQLAQWAINAVDFRDRDSIMTAFEYDAYPFNGWTVDGVLGVHPITGVDDSTTPNPDRRVVWGCEYPDLLLTETKAIHDRRSEDLDSPMGKTATGTPPGTDPHFDQRRIPQGSAFIELYNTRNPNDPVLPGDLYTSSGHLDLGRMDDNNTGTYPVWRLAVGERNDTPGTLADVATLLDTRDESLGLDVDDMDVVAPGPQDVEVERIVWFGAGPPAPGVIDADKIYYNVYATSSDVLLGPGQYAVVGPHRNPESGDENITTIGYTAIAPYAQEIRLGNTPAATGVGGRRSVLVSDVDGTATTYPDDSVTTTTPGTYDIQEPLGIAVAGDPTLTANAIWAGRDIGFSISEPLFSSGSYYPLPTDPTPTTVTHYDASTTTWLDKYAPPADEPFDNTNTELLALPETGTALNYKTVFLQRLADPTRAFDAINNPYLTVDWMPIDLTVFNGEESAAYPDPILPPPNADVRFGTRQRGSPRDPVAAPDPDHYYNIWKQPDWIDPVNWPPIVPATQTTNFGYDLDHTLGYLNLPFHDGTPPPGAPAWITTANVPTGEPYADSNGNNTYDAGEPFWDADNDATYDAADQLVQYVGDPLRPFPWLTWLDRPLASSMELLLVPRSSSARLLHEFEVGQATDNHYTDCNSGTPPPFQHLLNFFHATDMDTTPATWAGNYFRILEYVHVPSRFSGTEQLLNPTVFQAGSTVLLAGEGAPYYAPFNRLSRYRDPGRININTIFDDGTTWQGILNRLQESTVVDPSWNSGGFWSKVFRSRRGYGGTTNNFDLLNNDSPTFLANPFRSFGHGYVVPIESLRRVNTVPTGTLRRASVEASLMRSDPDTGTSTPLQPLFEMDSTTAATSASDYINTDRNSHFRYQVMQKLGNVVTTRSNVYAIWITVGYFEVERGVIDAVHPDGYRLGREMGSDTGDIKRDRAFYIYDRSIPVGFQRGENLNVEKGILVERVIE